MSFEWHLFRSTSFAKEAIDAYEAEVRRREAEDNEARERYLDGVRKDAEQFGFQLLQATLVDDRTQSLTIEVEAGNVTLRATRRAEASGRLIGIEWAVGRERTLRERVEIPTDRYGFPTAARLRARVEWLPVAGQVELGEKLSTDRNFERFKLQDAARFQGTQLTWKKEVKDSNIE